MRGIFDARQLLLQSFDAAHIKPEEVDIVINTHLHFDHCGWNTTRREDGSIVPTFPNARYFAHRGEVEHGHLQLERDAVSYISDNYDPLIANGQMTLLDPPSGGHMKDCSRSECRSFSWAHGADDGGDARFGWKQGLLHFRSDPHQRASRRDLGDGL